MRVRKRCGGGERLLHVCFFFFQAEDGIRDLVRSRGLGDVYKRQPHPHHSRRSSLILARHTAR